MSAKGCSSTLAQVGKDLSVEWLDAKLHWRDAKAREFEQKYLDELPALIAKARESMEELDVFLRKVRSECE